jgi:hypothetical protein
MPVAAFPWVFRQVGRCGRWHPVRRVTLDPWPLPDERITMQRFATPDAITGDAHQADFVLDFDAHAPWLHPALCLAEVRAVLAHSRTRWNLSPAAWQVAFSGNAGFHVTLPAALLGDTASPHLTAAYRRWASDLKDTLGLLTLDAPSRREPVWWQAHITAMLGFLPAPLADERTLHTMLRRPGIYTRRRMIRRVGSRHPSSDLYKTLLTADELVQGLAAIRQRAARPSPDRCSDAPDLIPHLGLITHLTRLIHQVSTPRPITSPASGTSTAPAHGSAPRLDVRLPQDAAAPVCIQRLLAHAPAPGTSNQRLLTLASYWRARGIPRERATVIAHDWLLAGVANPGLIRERAAAAVSVVRAVYAHGYRFGYPFVAALGVVSRADCAICPLRRPCHHGEPLA